MPSHSLALIAALFANPAAWSAPATIAAPVPFVRRLNSLTPDVADRLIRQLEDAQRRMRAGRPPPFTIATISVDTMEPHHATPRDVFLAMPFQAVWLIELENKRLWRRYRLAYNPHHPRDRRTWHIEVNAGFTDDIQSVVMDYRVPAPF